jgi:hypothetical protein
MEKARVLQCLDTALMFYDSIRLYEQCWQKAVHVRWRERTHKSTAYSLLTPVRFWILTRAL